MEKEIIFSKLDKKGKKNQIQVMVSALLFVIISSITLFSDFYESFDSILEYAVFKVFIIFPFLILLIYSIYLRDKHLKKIKY